MKKNARLFLCTILLTFSLVVPHNVASAAKLATDSNKMQNGSTIKVNLWYYYGNKKPKWSVSNKKIKIISKGKTWCKIKAKKVGTAYVKCKIGKKTYKKKITVKEKSKVTYENYSELKAGMTFNEVVNILGNYTDINSSSVHTEEEYQDILRWNKEDGGGWEDSLYKERVVYKWENPWNYHYIYCTFNDGILVNKEYN